jgi:4-amino-4-deoxy-L-arabinose transferase-like glycosyltransferase
MRRALCAVALLALACLLVRAARVGLAGDYVDSIGKITAQDEALYAHSAIRMARQGNWLTPQFMGRFALYKPPLLMWASGLSARVLGVSRLSLRIPVALLASLAVGLVFLWAAELRGWQAGACAAALVMSNHLWHVLGGMCMTDGLLAAFYVAAMYCLFSDPWLESRFALWGFAAAVAGAILTKSVAGALPLGSLAIHWLVVRPKERPALGRVCLAGGLGLALAAPWFAYQMAAHPRWFWAEHIGVELQGFGAGAPPQTSHENQALFYLIRLAAADPVLLAASLAAVPAFVVELRKRGSAATLLLCWLVLVPGAALGWQYRNAAYLLPMVPALALLATSYGPLASKQSVRWMLVLAGLAFLLKVSLPEMPWGIGFRSGTIQPQAPALSAYCERARGNELIVVDLGDDLYAGVLPLARLRYAIVAAGASEGRYAMPFEELGIVLSAAQFDDLEKWEPAFRRRLREWGLDSVEPIGTLVAARSAEELAAIVRAHPASDFFVPERYRAAVEPAAQAAHQILPASPDHFLLLSRLTSQRLPPAAWTCRM